MTAKRVGRKVVIVKRRGPSYGGSMPNLDSGIPQLPSEGVNKVTLNDDMFRLNTGALY